MASVAENVASYVASLGLGTLGTDLFVATMPTTPVVCTCVFPTGGFADPGDPTRRITFAIHHRNTHIASALSSATSLYFAVNEQWNVLADYPGRMVAESEHGANYRDASNYVIAFVNGLLITTKAT